MAAELRHRLSAFERASLEAEAPRTGFSANASLQADADPLAALRQMAAGAAEMTDHKTTYQVADLRAVIDQAIMVARTEARRRGGDLIVEGTFPPMACDPPLLASALAAMTLRALRACERAGVAPVVCITGGMDASLGRHILRIVDNGPEPEAWPSGERGRTPACPVDRLGNLEWMLIERVVASHHGSISVGVSSMGGSLVEVRLPVSSFSSPSA